MSLETMLADVQFIPSLLCYIYRAKLYEKINYISDIR